ncbi:MAG: Smr/MutS family protein [Pseudomonadota bacterium]
MSGRRRRGLTADDRRVWDQVARTARRRSSDVAAETPAHVAHHEDGPGAARGGDHGALRGGGGRAAVAAGARGDGASHAADIAPPPAGTGTVSGTFRRGAAHGRDGAPAMRGDVSAPVTTAGRGGSVARAGGMAQLRGGDALPGPVGRPEAGLDRRTAERLRKGAREPDARLDLHGLTAEQAHRRLDRFLAEAVSAGLRVVLVITGKGGRRRPEDAPWLPEGRGVLRDAAPRWIRQGAQGRRIVGIYEAHIRHGGAGAFYVYLRKPR